MVNHLQPFPKEDFRKEFIVNILIGFTIAEITIIYLAKEIGGLEFLITAIPLLSLYFVSKLGFYRQAFIFGCLYLYVIASIPLFGFAKDSFTSLVLFTLLLIIIFALTNFSYAFLALFIAIFTLGISNNIDLFVETKLGIISQFMFFPLCMGVGLCVGWLPNQRIRESLREIKQTEHLLRKEKSLLDLRLKQRTASLFKLADLGVITQRLIHDISTPLNVLLLNMTQITPHNIKQTQEAVRRAQYGTTAMTKFVEEVRDKISNQDNKTWFEVVPILETVKYICETKNVKIKFKCYKDIQVFGNESKLLQIVANLTQNSVEAYEKKEGLIYLKVDYLNNHLEMLIKDKGGGMDQTRVEDLGNFTTKTDTKLNGIGYETAKELTETDFNGKIHTKSTKNKGTKTTILIKAPVRLRSDHAHQP